MAPWEVKVVDPLSGEVVAPGVEGEICSRGYGNMIDYFDMPEKTAETIDDDGWLHSGDLGTMDERGYVRITGRLKDMIIRGGENIFPAEIENRLYAHPSIANVAVVGVPDETWGEQVAAVVQLAEGATLDVAALHAFCRETLASHKVPRLWYTTDEYPLTGSGKVQKFVLVEQISKGALQPFAAKRHERPHPPSTITANKRSAAMLRDLLASIATASMCRVSPEGAPSRPEARTGTQP